MARRVIDVFLSSTATDLAEHRKAVHDRLSRTGLFHCVRQEDFGAQDAGAVDFCRCKAQEADMFVGLIGLRRGWEPEGDNEKRSITEMEHDWARDAGRPRYLWVMPDDFPLPGTMRESDELHARQMDFRKHVMGGGGRVVSQKGFGSPELLASEVVEQLMVQVVTTDLLKLIQREAASPGQPAPSKEEQAPAIAAAVERLAEDKDVDLLALAKDPKGIDVAELEAKLMAREKELEEEAQLTTRKRAEYWRHIGALAFLNDTKKALQAYGRAVDLDRNNPDGWLQIGRLLNRVGETTEAQKAFERMLRLGESSMDKAAQADACRHLGRILMQRGDLGPAENFCKKSVVLNAEIERKGALADSQMMLGTVFQRQGRLKEAKAIYFQSLAQMELVGDLKGVSDAHLSLGNVLRLKGKWKAAEDHYAICLSAGQSLENKECMANGYCGLALIYQRRGDLDRAEDMQLKALKLDEELGHKEGIANAYCGLALIYQRRGDLDRAEDMQLKVLKVEEELGRKQNMADVYWNLGMVYDNRRDKARSCECYRKARDLYREIGIQGDADEMESWLLLNGCGEE